MEDAKTVRYVSKDPIQNLKIRVNLWRLSVQKSRATINKPNETDPAQAQGQAQGQAQAQAQAQAQGALQQQQPFPQPLPPPSYGQDGQPLPAGPAPGAPAGTDPQAAATGAGVLPQPLPAGGPYPAAGVQQQQAQYVGPQQQQIQYRQQQAQFPQQQVQFPQQQVQFPQQQAQYMPPPAPQRPPGPQAGQAVAESFDMARPGPIPGPPRSRQGSQSGGRGTRQRMSVQQRLDAASVAAAGAPLSNAAISGVRGREQAAAADPFAAWGRGAGGDTAPYPQPRRQGRPLGEAIEHPEDGSADGGELQRRRQRRMQQAGQQGAAPAADPAAAAQQQPQDGAAQQQNPQQQQQGAAAAAPAAPGNPQQPAAPQPQGGLGAIMIPPQAIPNVVPYGSLGPEARMVAMGQPPDVPPTMQPNELPEKYKTGRVFGWQEKVYSRMEVAASQAAAAQAAQASGAPAPDGAAAAAAAAAAGTNTTQPGAGLGQGQDPQLTQPQPGGALERHQSQHPPPVPSKRTMAFGSNSTMNNKQLDPRIQGSILFTFVQSDEFCIAQELGRTVTTSLFEDENFLVHKLLSNPKGRQQVLSFRSMYIVADLGEEGDAGASNERVLVSIRAYPDGSFDMCPGFSRPGFKYRFEDNHGGIFEFTVENASATDIPSLEKRTAKLERAVVARAEELRRAALKSDFEEPPAADCTRLLLLAEIQSAADYPRDRLYVEYVARWDPELWDLATPWPQQEPGVVQGVTHISRVTVYPADPSLDAHSRDVAHFAHPIELEWVSRGRAISNRHPSLFFQVCTLDKFNRYTCEGYGWLSLDGRVPGSGTHTVKTWKPLGTIRDKQAEFFVGGSAELADLAYLTTPSGFNGKILNKYGFKTETVGAVKVRVNTVTQRYNPDAAALAALRRSGGSPGPLRGGLGAAALAKKNSRKDMSLKMVVERARQRLKEARGTDDLPGGDVGVRPGLVSEIPTVVVHPQDAAVPEESTVRFKVVARGLPPLKYEWYKDDRRLMAATADQPELVLVQTSLESEGAYYCQVSNKDGSVNSSKATLTVTRAARVSRATAGDGGEARTPRRPPRTGAVSPSGSAAGARLGEGGKVSRLSRLEAAAARASGSIAGSDGGQMSPTTGGPPSQASGGSGGGAVVASPRISAAGAVAIAGPGLQQQTAAAAAPAAAAAGTGTAPPTDAAAAGDQPGLEAFQLPPPAMPPVPAAPRPAPGADAGGDGVSGFLPPSVAAAATSGFRRRPPRPTSAGGGSGSGSSGGGAPGAAPPAAAATTEMAVVEEVEEEVVVPAPKPRRMAGPGQQPPPPQQQQQAAPAPQRAPPRRNDDDDLEAEEIE